MLSALLLAPLSLSTRGARHAPPRSCAAAAGAPDEAQLALFASLRARSLEIEREVAERWREAAPVSSVPVALNDWIRRVALDWPLAACGTARGGLVLADLSSGDMLACAQDAHPSVVDTPEVRSAMRELHGEYDGNGVLSVALCGSRVASAGREGGVRLWRLDGDELVPTAELKVGALASSLLLPAGEEGPLWASFLDGSLCRWSSLGGEEPSLVVSCSAAALAAACCAPLELVAAATSAGEVELFSTRDGSPHAAAGQACHTLPSSQLRWSQARRAAVGRRPRSGRRGASRLCAARRRGGASWWAGPTARSTAAG